MEDRSIPWVPIVLVVLFALLFPRRKRRPAKSKRTLLLNLKPGQILMTEAGSFTAMRKPTTTTITCNCTKAVPDTPDCEAKTTVEGSVVTVTCKPVRGCSACGTDISVPSAGLHFSSAGIFT